MNSQAGDTGAEPSQPFSGLTVGDSFGPVEYDVSAPANDRYWRAAGIEHALRNAGLLYPPMAANLTILALQTVAPAPLLHTRQRLTNHRGATAPATVVVTGTVTDRFERRGRVYLEVTAEFSIDGEALWTSIATFIPAGSERP